MEWLKMAQTENHMYVSDIKDMDEEEEGKLWFADSSGGRVNFYPLHIRRHTPKGVWYTGGQEYRERWMAKGSKKYCTTRRAALQNLVARKGSYVAHSERRFKAAMEQLAVAQAAAESVGVKYYKAGPQEGPGFFPYDY